MSKKAMEQALNEMENCCEVPIVEKLRSVPKDYRTCVAIQWAENGAETGHRFIPVGYMMHEAADEIERLQALVPNQ
jgi:hypothetical protein